MATIAYGVCGYGLGHAARAKTIIDSLKDEHEFILYAPSSAFEYLNRVYHGEPRVSVVKLNCSFEFLTGNGQILWLPTMLESAKTISKFNTVSKQLAEEMRIRGVRLAVSDLDPFVSRAGRKAGIPVVSVDSHSKFSFCDLNFTPKLRVARSLVSQYTRFVYGGTRNRSLICTFSDFEVKKKYKSFSKLVGPVLRSEIMSAAPTDENFLLVYLRKDTLPGNIVPALEACGVHCRIYGLGIKKDTSNLTYHDLGEGFVKDLAHCGAVFSTAGNQLFCETFFLGKPVLTFPEPGQIEQYLNAHLINQTQAGEATLAQYVTPDHLKDFWSRRHRYIDTLKHWRERMVPANEVIRNEFRCLIEEGVQNDIHF